MSSTDTREFDLMPADAGRLAMLCGQFDEHLKHIERRMSVRIGYRGHHFRVEGPSEHATAAAEVLRHLYRETEAAEDLTPETVHLYIRESGFERLPDEQPFDGSDIVIKTPKFQAKPRSPNQQWYVHNIRTHDVNFGIGPAGTGKTWLAVACAVEALKDEEVKRILLVRPAVEAGEKLGFLPGDLAQKVDPYLRPLYDALYEMIGFDQVTRLIEKNIIEIAPLAFMRGRTLNNAFIILDESQNTTREQMKMFLTRIGFGSTAIITGDITQVDLPRGQHSGLIHAAEVLRTVPGIGFTRFGASDVVRHPLVQRIVEAYDDHDGEAEQ
ncbi:phosphate starvation-inducible protein PhoH [Tamilnaduibacter salinus]|uniref:PhoH-like protein n=1 Tax=Tamilnaduibacter salinus TaxID=1484056 RepID=A0A2A2I483_9GAMM|nr:PhoH family protein [Tamilnaduibacter salinus]PAV26208.1 PhoH family protein [Tamilnaduibacter salinus]PVY70737.1 phosphate starvation-inducible protein PhoH [Tamilnaduibacter salinus]